MLTSSLVTLVKREFPDWSRPLILTLFDEVQKMVFTQNATRQMRMYDASTGKDPVLTTVSGTYEYEISTSNGFDNNAWRVCVVYTDSIDEPVDVDFFDSNNTYQAKILFKDDPGSTTYYIRAYRFCNSLISESVSLEVPASYHLTHIFEGVCGLIEKYRSGKSERWDIFEKMLLPELVKKMSDSNGAIYTVPYKGY